MQQVPLIAVDVRMARNSGIGRYIREVAPRVRKLLPEVRWHWVGNTAEEWMEADRRGTEFVLWPLPVYSYREHCRTQNACGDADVRWVPHYNVTPGSKARLVVTMHDVLPLRYASGWRGALRAIVFRWYLARIRRHARLVLSNSAFTAKELAESARIAGARVKVTPLGCNLSVEGYNSAVSSKLPAALGARMTQPVSGYFLFVGNIKPHKNLSGLLFAWSRVSDQIPEDLVIVGQREGFFTGDPAAARLADGLGRRVVFTGHLPDAHLRQLMTGATALVQPSFYEGFGLPVLEAMAAGCPVISSNAASLPEVGGEAVIYFDPHNFGSIAEKLVQVSRDDGLRQQLRAAGLVRAREFTWDRTAELTATALREVLAMP